MNQGVFRVRGAVENNGPLQSATEYALKLLQECGDVDIAISEHSETRRQSQNRLMWLWNGQIGQASGVSADYAHGMCKLDVLLPLALSGESTHKRASFVRDVVNQVIKREHKIAVAYDMMRTSDLTVKQFAHYLNSVDRHYARQGLALMSPDDLRIESLMIRGNHEN
jgi:hypothetical protein